MRRHGPVMAHCTDSEDFPLRSGFFSERIAAWMHQSLKSTSVESGALRPFQEQQQQQQQSAFDMINI